MRILPRFFMAILLIIAFSIGFIPTRGANAVVTDCINFIGPGTISQAVADANGAIPLGGTITFTCSGTIMFDNQLTINQNVTINGGGVITFNETGDDNRFFVVSSGASLTLDGLTLQNGNGDFGGAIFNVGGGTLDISNSTFTNNSASNNGGAIHNAGTLTISNSTFTGNSASDGGAIYNGGTATISDSAFTGNSASNGGAIYNSTGTATINDSAFTSNSVSSDGGAIYNSTGTVNSIDSTFTTNLASDGGAIFNFAGIVNSTNSTFTSNSVSSDGGAIYNNGGTVNSTNSTFTGNGANNGGAINNNGTATINDSTFTGNSASNGGAINNNGSVNSQDSHYVNNTCFGAITDNNGNTVNNATGCPGTAPITLNVSALSCDSATGNAQLTINAGDNNFDVTGTGAGLPMLNVGLGLQTIIGTGSWTNIIVTERTGERQSTPPSNITCPIPISTTAVCIGNNLQVTILTGDAPFQVTASSGTLATGLGIGTHLISPFGSQTGVNVTELAGDTENFPLGDIDCTPNNLSASAVCVGADLHVTIGNGEAPFQITSTAGTLATGLSAGLHIIPNAGAQTGVNVTELAGDTQNFPLGNFNCVSSVIPPTTPTTTSAVTVLGCALDNTDGVELGNAPDNTYCRVLMKNGGVVSYSGAVPRELIGLGVILAVDVYRLQGGMSVNNFPDYARVCLAGQGRLFYMDGRNAPRVSIELASEAVDGLTCGWIPAPGTLILTN